MKISEFITADGVRIVDHQGPVYLVQQTNAGRSDSNNNVFSVESRFVLKRIEPQEISLNLALGSNGGDDRVGIPSEYVSAKQLWTTAGRAMQHMAECMFERASSLTKCAGGAK